MAEAQIEAATPKREPFDIDDDILSNVDLSSIMDSFTPQTFDSPSSLDSQTGSPSCSESQQSPEPTPEKKPVKKRKSWGQELPTPTTNLPPRKRAKTEAEKEQRRIERVLRNRAAAQSSRERKRKEVEALEDQKNGLADENKALHDRNTKLEALNTELNKRVEAVFRQNELLQTQLKLMQEEFHKSKEKMPDFNPLLLTPPVDISHDITSPLFSEPSTPPRSDGTLDPSHLSTPSTSKEDPFSLTQHTAVMLCHSQDLPCQLKTGPSLEVEAMLAIIQWTLLLRAAISSQIALLEVIFYFVTNRPIPESELPRLFPLIHLLITIKPTQRLRCRLLSISQACALILQPGMAQWSVCPTNVLDLVRSGFSSVPKEEDEDPASACRKFVMEYLARGGIDYGPVEGDNIDSRTQHGKMGFDFSSLVSLSEGK